MVRLQAKVSCPPTNGGAHRLGSHNLAQVVVSERFPCLQGTAASSATARSDPAGGTRCEVRRMARRDWCRRLSPRCCRRAFHKQMRRGPERRETEKRRGTLRNSQGN
eukprot:1120508-Pleurochrysis_carterae.AAC.8